MSKEVHFMWNSKEIAARALQQAAVIKTRRKRRGGRLITAALVTASLSLTVCVCRGGMT